MPTTSNGPNDTSFVRRRTFLPALMQKIPRRENVRGARRHDLGHGYTPSRVLAMWTISPTRPCLDNEYDDDRISTSGTGEDIAIASSRRRCPRHWLRGDARLRPDEARRHAAQLLDVSRLRRARLAPRANPRSKPGPPTDITRWLSRGTAYDVGVRLVVVLSALAIACSPSSSDLDGGRMHG